MTNDNSPDELRSLWQTQTVAPFHISPDELRLKMKQLDRKLLMRDVIVYVICAGETIWFTYLLLAKHVPPTLRVGFILIILAMGFLALQFWLDRHDRKAHRTMAAASGYPSSVEFVRAELVRLRNFHRGIWFWSRLIALLPGLLVCGIWAIAVTPKSPIGYAVTAATFLISVWAIFLNQKRSLSLQRQITTLDAVRQQPG